jgi:transcriptional regulator yfif
MENIETMRVPSLEHFATHITSQQDEYRHNHEFFEFFYILEGTIRHECNEEISQLAFGDCYILRPNTDIHCFLRDDSCSHRDICVDATRFRNACDYISPDLYACILSNCAPIRISLSLPEINFFEQKLNDIKYAPDDELWKKPYLIKCFLSAFLSTYYNIQAQVRAPYPLWFRTLLTKFYQPELIKKSVPELIEDVNYNQIYICHTFKKYTGMTMTQFLNKRRMELAKVYLCSTKLTIISISEELGYSYPYRFNQVFKETFHMTPKEYRKKFSQPD